MRVSLSERLFGAMVLDRDTSREHPIEVDLVLELPSLELSGRIAAGPIVREAPLSGRATGDARARRLRYELGFRADDGLSLRLTLERRLTFENVYTSLTVLPGEIDDARGTEIARCLLRYDARAELGRSLSSLRFPSKRRSPP